MVNNVEEELKYNTTYEKPYKTYTKTLEWGELPENWRTKMIEILEIIYRVTSAISSYKKLGF